MDQMQERPGSLRIAVACLWTSAGLVAIAILLEATRARGSGDLVFSAVIGVITVGVLALVATRIKAGRPWACWLYVAFFAFGAFGFAASLVFGFEQFKAQPLVAQAMLVVQFAFETAALVLMFTPASRQFMRRSG